MLAIRQCIQILEQVAHRSVLSRHIRMEQAYHERMRRVRARERRSKRSRTSIECRRCSRPANAQKMTLEWDCGSNQVVLMWSCFPPDFFSDLTSQTPSKMRIAFRFRLRQLFGNPQEGTGVSWGTRLSFVVGSVPKTETAKIAK